MPYHHLAVAVADMKATHHFYEDLMGFELVKVEVAKVPSGGWAKHFFYRMDGDDTRFIAFWEMHETQHQNEIVYSLNEAAKLPPFTNHYSYNVDSVDELNERRERWNADGLDVIDIDHNWCHSVYTFDPSGNVVEFCLTTGEFTANDRERALAAIDETEFNPSQPPKGIKTWPAKATA